MAFWGVEFTTAPLLEWRMWTPFLAFVSFQFVFLIVHIAAQDALVGVIVFLSCASCVSCIVWRRAAVLLANFVMQCFLFFVLLVCAVTGASSMAGLHENKRYMALIVFQFLAFSLGLAACGALAYRFKRTAPVLPVAAPVRKPPIEFCEEVRRTSSHQSLRSNGTDSGLLTTLFGFVSSSSPSICWSQCLSDAEVKTASTEASRSLAPASEKNSPAPIDKSAALGLCNRREICAAEGREGDWFLSQSLRQDQDKEQVYQDALGSFPASSSLVACQAPSQREVPPAAQVPACALSSLAPCLNASLVGEEVSSAGALGDERDLHRDSGESIVVFSATDDKGVFFLRTTSVSPAPSPTHLDSEASSFDLAAQPLDANPQADARREPESLPPQPSDTPATTEPRRYRVGAYSCEDYAYRQTSDGEPPATYIVQLSDTDCSGGNRSPGAGADGARGSPKTGLAIEQGPPSPLQDAWKALKRKSRRSVQHAIHYLSSGEAPSDRSGNAVPVDGSGHNECGQTPQDSRTAQGGESPTGPIHEGASVSGVSIPTALGSFRPHIHRGLRSPVAMSPEDVSPSAPGSTATGDQDTTAEPSGNVQTLSDTLEAGGSHVESTVTTPGAEVKVSHGGNKIKSRVFPSSRSSDIFPELRSDDQLDQEAEHLSAQLPSGHVPEDARTACAGGRSSAASKTGWVSAGSEDRSCSQNTRYAPPSLLPGAAETQAEWPEDDFSSDEGSVNLSLSSSEADSQVGTHRDQSTGTCPSDSASADDSSNASAALIQKPTGCDNTPSRVLQGEGALP
ncbi:Proteophosphoglycan ppg4, related [Neospora caninum Liverpool]|uniref:Proteophosphoglycan ppg4, related n=1 Tax=Neospora caninum (strain Liverpool) TaxID=572307 RepID=F0VEV2_NEOCL|nr:Proteophosphoglycan ppg4, related [Neospora caninum Liverpool]CBZ52246.1 Proteophosphoglycan ppg4, related [Neospora caninum Liverpool]CEL66214.1 TPA: Proteophosphoglycan ppg4, related [Neospora caninum Liverpool]|eukprot:XP_003882278.1 Proteophosphoglycan ppg4, related [Neospora caninum Liverpool]